MELPESYRQLQKIAGQVPEASGNGKKKDIIKSLEAADPEEVEKAKAQVLEQPEKQETSDKEKETEEEVSESSENQPEEPELEYTGDRNHSGDLLGRQNPEEEVLETLENSEDEVELTSEEDEDTGKTSEDEKVTAEPVELDTRVFKMPHLLINKGISILVRKKWGREVPELSENDLEELAKDTEIVVEEHLDHRQKEKLQSQSGLVGIAVRHLKNVMSSFSRNPRPEKKEQSSDNNDQGETEQPHLENELEESKSEKHAGSWT